MTMNQPFDDLMDNVDWKKIDHDPCPKGLFATHEGLLSIFGLPIKVYILNDGQRVFDANSAAKILNAGNN